MKTDKIQVIGNIPIPKMIIDNHSEEVISMDFIFVQGIPFHHSISESYKNRVVDSLSGKIKANNANIKNMSR